MKRKNFLMIRILLLFINSESGSVQVTQIARTLGEEKYTISRALSEMEQEGFVNRRDSRHPVLTNIGIRQAREYADRINVIQNHLMYEGLDPEHASEDAFYWAIYSSKETMTAIRNLEGRYRLRHEFKDRNHFSGAQLCRNLCSGTYVFPFLIYRENVKDGSNISMANEGFSHPCTLQVQNGKGKIFLHAVEMTARSGKTDDVMRGMVGSVKYFDSGSYVSAEKRGNNIIFPTDSIQFRSIGSGAGQILHGSISLKMTCTVGTIHMPESIAIFTIII